MNDREFVRDQHGDKIGEILISDTKCVLRDTFGNRLGDYDAIDEYTRDRHGNIIGRGKLLTTLLNRGTR